MEQVPNLNHANLPYMEIGLAAGDISVGSPQSHRSELVIRIRFGVNAGGMDELEAWKDVLKVYREVELAINPFGDMSWLRDAVHVVDPTVSFPGQITFKQAGFPSVRLPDINAVGAECIFTVPMKITTCGSTPDAPVA